MHDLEARGAGSGSAVFQRQPGLLEAVAVVGDRIVGLQGSPFSLVPGEIFVAEAHVTPREIERAEAVSPLRTEPWLNSVERETRLDGARAGSLGTLLRDHARVRAPCC